jgi:hypothetical protein
MLVTGIMLANVSVLDKDAFPSVFIDHIDRAMLEQVNLLKRVNHVNLVKLLGYCQNEQRVLVYEFAEEGSIGDHLHGQNPTNFCRETER